MPKSVLRVAAERAQRKKDKEGDQALSSVPAASGRKRRAVAQEEAQTSTKSNNAKKVKLSADLRPLDVPSALVNTSTSNKKKLASQAGSIIYLGHIPDGFFEQQMETFFVQFGDVMRVKLFRSKKTNRSKGYAFVEFESPEVAAVVAEAMDGYFLSDRKLVCHVIPAEKMHDKMFSRPKVQSGKADSGREDKEKGVDDANFDKVSRMHLKSMAAKQAKLRELGIDFNIPFAKNVEERVEEESKPKAPVAVKKEKAAAKKKK
jgi:nucleolar protein 15